MRTHHRLDVTLTLLGPILTRGGEAARAGLDAAVARNSDGFPMLPYSLVKGKVVDALRRLHPGAFERRDVNRKPKFRASDRRLADWFGNATADGGYDPDRGRVRFSDFVAAAKGNEKGVIERVRIDPDTGAAAGRMLMMLEAPFGYGEPVAFRGTVDLVGDAGEADALRDLLDKAFAAVPAFGALKTVGFGRTQKVDVTVAAVPVSAAGTPAVGPVLAVQWTPDRPLCLVGPKHSRNHFESLESIPGSVLKGAAARLLLEVCGAAGTEVTPAATDGHFPLLGRHFALVRFGEARPVAPGRSRPVVAPLSVVVSSADEDKGKWYDVAREPKPRLIGGLAPRFVADWKPDEEERVRAAFGWPPVRTERRTRTSVNADTGRAADEELFSYGLVVPDDLTWDGVIGLHDVPDGDRPGVAAELARLLTHGLPHVGKTRAVAAVTWLPRPTAPAVASRHAEGPHVVTLQTDFLMTDPDLLKDGAPLRDVYAAFWAEASGGALRLERFFARQALQGGYLAHRFGRGGYEPFLVTDRGSVFVLTATGTGDPGAVLDGWAERSLPLPGWVKVRYGEPLWKTCPFLPHAGFGEVAIDLDCHTDPEHQPPS
ncbi:MAG TPA: RAMP superfamily CRISPR-associated protein [Urbifossiella sp.]|nr:RAMP superfamily CRISPR-associated protein [Urbifossiella sp.]